MQSCSGCMISDLRLQISNTGLYQSLQLIIHMQIISTTICKDTINNQLLCSCIIIVLFMQLQVHDQLCTKFCVSTYTKSHYLVTLAIHVGKALLMGKSRYMYSMYSMYTWTIDFYYECIAKKFLSLQSELPNLSELPIVYQATTTATGVTCRCICMVQNRQL